MGFLQKSIRWRIQNGNGDLILLALAFLIGYIQNEAGPQKYYYDNGQIIVEVNEGYQCPTHCAIDHHHSVYFTGKGMIIDEEQLGSRYREKKNHRKK